MVGTLDLVQRSGGLKSALLEFSQQDRYVRGFQDLLSSHNLNIASVRQDQLIHTLDFFVLQHRLRNGQTIVEQFVATRRDLSQREREMLLGWREVVEGIFEVTGHDRVKGALVVENLIDDLTYRVLSNMGAEVFRTLRPGSFILARLVPIGEEWLVSGTMHPIAKRRHDAVYTAAANLALEQPKLAFRNPGSRRLVADLSSCRRRPSPNGLA